MKRILPFLLILTLGACASIVKGTRQTVNVTTNPPANANCTLVDSKHKTYTVAAPGSVVLNKGDGPLKVECSTEIAHGQKIVDENVEGWWNYNGFFFLLAPVTYIIDAISGAYQTYPQDIDITIVGGAQPPLGLNNAR